MDIKPTAFARAVPPEERNGFYGIEEQLVAQAQEVQAGPMDPIVAVVTYTLDDVVQKVVKGEQYPVVKAYSIEPLHNPEAIKQAIELRDAAMKSRTGIEALDLPEVDE